MEVGAVNPQGATIQLEFWRWISLLPHLQVAEHCLCVPVSWRKSMQQGLLSFQCSVLSFDVSTYSLAGRCASPCIPLSFTVAHLFDQLDFLTSGSLRQCVGLRCPLTLLSFQHVLSFSVYRSSLSLLAFLCRHHRLRTRRCLCSSAVVWSHSLSFFAPSSRFVS